MTSLTDSSRGWTYRAFIEQADVDVIDQDERTDAMTSYAIDTFAMAHVFESAAPSRVHISARSRRRLASLAVLGFVFAVAILHLGTAILHPSAATASECGVAIVGP